MISTFTNIFFLFLVTREILYLDLSVIGGLSRYHDDCELRFWGGRTGGGSFCVCSGGRFYTILIHKTGGRSRGLGEDLDDFVDGCLCGFLRRLGNGNFSISRGDCDRRSRSCCWNTRVWHRGLGRQECGG